MLTSEELSRRRRRSYAAIDATRRVGWLSVPRTPPDLTPAAICVAMRAYAAKLTLKSRAVALWRAKRVAPRCAAAVARTERAVALPGERDSRGGCLVLCASTASRRRDCVSGPNTRFPRNPGLPTDHRRGACQGESGALRARGRVIAPMAAIPVRQPTGPLAARNRSVRLQKLARAQFVQCVHSACPTGPLRSSVSGRPADGI